ncbi:hypothetical protein EDD18DRAFT_860490 [Armillaria luteobubalina]|uniref:Btz domain-containing protein n=1 Tax=Armillaria luteobubalina TaxID=153913 RepID=A0AA39QB93_9AGAR|nr:hypothetical protein EDD18DRAFT_860490 [Armillaria luteobubalina]
MPVPTPSSVSTSTASKSSIAKTHGHQHAKKTRIVRRRGRAMDSDDEIVREVGTDSESENGAESSDGSSDSDTEQVSDDASGHRRPRVLTPSTSQSPTNGVPAEKETSTSFFAPSGNWSEMVAEENSNGPADLPVIDFAEFNGSTSAAKPTRQRKTKKSAPKVKLGSEATSLPSPPLSVNEDHEEESVEEAPPAASSTRPTHRSDFIRRPPGQTARQAYQNRLESDPSYVPTVGEFWGHDDRLLDKDLRSLSGWWRGRWQGRGYGRGRGFDRSFAMRGRGGFMARNAFPHQDSVQEDEEAEAVDVPPVERAWTHDGFEEMKRSDEARRSVHQHQSQPFRGAGRVRGGAPTRERGGFARTAGPSASPALSANAPLMSSGRIWYPMKPELAWTKQHEGFLYIDASMKPRRGRGAGYRVRIPGSRGQIVRTPLTSTKELPIVTPSGTSTTSVLGSEYGEKTVVVRLPSAEKSKSVSGKPQLVTAKPIPLPEPSSSRARSSTLQSQSTPSLAVQQKLEQLSIQPPSDSTRWSQTEEAVLRNPSSSDTPEQQPSSSTSDSRPSLVPVPTSFPSSVSQPSPAYVSPYHYGVPLPPGVAVNPVGMPYEVATGRPVYLPPPPMYNPRPMMPPLAPTSAPFVPGHMHHQSTPTADYASHTPPVNGFIDPATGMPIFSFAPPSSRIEIRAPGEGDTDRTQGKERASSGLRSTAATFEPIRPAEDTSQEYSEGSGITYQSEGGAENGTVPVDQVGMMYAPYGQYYYPETYGYMPYMDMSQVPQYEMYNEHIPQGTVYY